MEYLEIENIYTDAGLEIWASEMHAKYKIDQIFSKSEDLMLRAAYMREAFGIKEGLSVRTPLMRRRQREAALRPQPQLRGLLTRRISIPLAAADPAGPGDPLQGQGEGAED